MGEVGGRVPSGEQLDTSPGRDGDHAGKSSQVPEGRGPNTKPDQTNATTRQPRRSAETPMPTVKLRASTILGAFEQAQSELIGKAVVLTDGKAGTVEKLWLDELHGLRISVKGHDGRWPVSTVKFAENG
ncbi:MAG: hypothetical protein JWO19_6059 [Bryobacterales bacterium]|nr:hypothetical protein [Bryobacterales bacterium]